MLLGAWVAASSRCITGSGSSATSSSEPRFSSQRRPRPGEHLSDHLGGEGQFPSLCDVPDPRGLQIRVPCLGAPRAVRQGAQRCVADLEDQGDSRARAASMARGVYGSRRVQAELRLGQDIVVSRKRIRRLMRQAGISGLVKVKKGRTTIRVPGVRVADDLLERKLRPEAPNVLWVPVEGLAAGVHLNFAAPEAPSPTPVRTEHDTLPAVVTVAA